MIELRDYQNRYPNFRLERDADGVLSVVFHTDGASLVWGIEPLAQLSYLWRDVGADRGNKVVVVSGSGEGFIPSMAVGGDARMTAEAWDTISSDVRRLIRGHLDIEVPMIAAVNGPARYHSEQALLCDIVIASENAEFQDGPHFNSGMVPGDGVQILYNHLLGANRARYFMFMGETIDARRALELGLISEIHSSRKLRDRAMEIARHILKQPELVRRYTRQASVEPLRRAYSGLLDHGLALEGLGAWGGWPFEEKN